MALLNYEIDSDILNEKEDDFDPTQYAAGSVDAMGAYYTYLSNSIARIDLALKETTKDDKLKKLLESDDHYSNVYNLLIEEPYYMKEIKNAIATSSIVKEWDEGNLLGMYTDRIADMIDQLKHQYPEEYIKLVNRVFPYEVSAYYDLEYYKSINYDHDDDTQF